MACPQVPKQILQSRMVGKICLPKVDKLENCQISANDWRPITILSAFWRFLVFYHVSVPESQAVAQWLQRNFLS